MSEPTVPVLLFLTIFFEGGIAVEVKGEGDLYSLITLLPLVASFFCGENWHLADDGCARQLETFDLFF